MYINGIDIKYNIKKHPSIEIIVSLFEESLDHLKVFSGKSVFYLF
jgi:hypothetical protein